MSTFFDLIECEKGVKIDETRKSEISGKSMRNVEKCFLFKALKLSSNGLVRWNMSNLKFESN